MRDAELMAIGKKIVILGFEQADRYVVLEAGEVTAEASADGYMTTPT